MAPSCVTGDGPSRRGILHGRRSRRVPPVRKQRHYLPPSAEQEGVL